jgi:hypothetical protein
MLIAIFIVNAPFKCNELEIKKYKEEYLNSIFEDVLRLIQSKTEDHSTPFETRQPFFWFHYDVGIND